MKHYSILTRIITTWICIFFFSAFAYSIVIEKRNNYILKNIEVPRNDTLVVDQSSRASHKKFSNGSPEHPFVKIGDALEFAKFNNKFSKILVHPGKYEENIILEKGVDLLGQGQGVEIIHVGGTTNKTIRHWEIIIFLI